ncbi:hypothetical protein SAMN02745857_02616 [Andreprevotia lacus DSM 23236]|jgi:cytoplasmic iron level regulating protein YaaA (DUF328/UPF0246 family)|uniref:UPF0246 protein SAMN02745857_02616 n=1 Tax=Andreprevotia lacus DSM 23236 TaxID=1121001 RepID=A0A1W1XSL4_9NEIS|nr:peroxide stress protein YaaA [Andreprevotia lacus]SMC26854.1 hypothetical protein SAMN02745857_02616 [Andreprevotia lacus DSM 23236]
MLMLISPAKTLDYQSPLPTPHHTEPAFLPQAQRLIDVLRPLPPAELSRLMQISDELAVLNAGRYQSWQTPFTPANARAAVFAFMGDVYEGLDSHSLDARGRDYLEKHLRILSGLYGLLKPFDLIQPYRLEMGTRLVNPAGKDLYAFWGETITQTINAGKPGVVVNLASEEYFKAVKPKLLNAPVITPVFEDYKGGRYKIISFYAKRARGLMVRYAALHGVCDVQALKQFDFEDYRFVPEASEDKTWLFRRRLQD